MASCSRRRLVLGWKRDALLLTIGIAMVLWIVNSLGMFQWLELLFFDQLMRHRPAESQDPHITIVGITEADIQRENQWPIADEVLAAALNRLNAYQPRVIGLDLYRDVPVAEGYAELARVLQNTPNLIVVEKRLGNAVKPPPMVPESRIGFIDFVLDPDGILRRGLLSVEARQSFGALVALRYLKSENIELVPLPDSAALGQTQIPRLNSNTGAYTQIDASGYQILINFRGAGCAQLPPKQCSSFRLYSFTQLLTDQIPPADLRDQIVLIGAIAPSLQDSFPTPYRSGENNQTSGIEIHAHLISQIIQAALGHRKLIGHPSWSNPVKFLWLLGWTALATVMGSQSLRYPFLSWAFIPLLTLSLLGLSFLFFLQGLWVPTILPLMAIVLGSFLSQRRILWVSLQESYVELAVYATTLEEQVADRTQSLAQEVEQHQATAEALHQANQKLQKLAMLDGLTQVANRRRFDDYLEQEWQRSQREEQWLSLVICDIDHFKAYNDTYGHPAGDRCIQELAKILQETLHRPADLVARYGGEEFALVLPHTHPLGAAKVVKEVQKRIDAINLEHRGSPVAPYVTLSLGIAGLIPNTQFSPEFLIFQADQALYQAKANGRNQFVLADPTPPRGAL